MTDDDTLPADVATYLDTLVTQRRLAPRTCAMYRLALRELSATHVGLPLEQLTPAHLRQALARLQQRGQSPRSLAIALSAWRGFYGWLARQGRLDANPAAGMRAPRAPRLLPKALTPDAVHQLIEREAATPREVRNRAMFELLYSSGLRLAELVSLDASACADSAGWLSDALDEVTVTGKGAKRRSVPVGRLAAQAIRAWLAVRGACARAEERALFVGQRGRRIAPAVVERELRAWSVAQGLPAPVHPHMLRHSFASHVLQSSGDLRAVQEMLGHASIATTQVYTRLDYQHLAQVYDRAHPRARKKSG